MATSKTKKKNTEITLQQARAITYLLAGWSQRDTAIKLGLTHECITVWNRQSHFAEAKEKASKMVLDAAYAELVSGYQLAARKLLDIIENDAIPVRYQLQAIGLLFQSIHRSSSSKLPEIYQGMTTEEITGNLLVTASNRNEAERALDLLDKEHKRKIAEARLTGVDPDKFQNVITEIANLFSKVDMNDAQRAELVEDVVSLLQTHDMNFDLSAKVKTKL
jgi:hypothetical protein